MSSPPLSPCPPPHTHTTMHIHIVYHRCPADVHGAHSRCRIEVSETEEIKLGSNHTQALTVCGQLGQSPVQQFRLCLLRNLRSYDRISSYMGVRVLATACIALLLGSVFWNIAAKRCPSTEIYSQQSILMTGAGGRRGFPKNHLKVPSFLHPSGHLSFRFLNIFL